MVLNTKSQLVEDKYLARQRCHNDWTIIQEITTTKVPAHVTVILDAGADS